ncbi:MAG TPA: hypothetical protein VLQ93_03625, partial [Myxococcaceae bacterium]|nr:hypothetical protein [Myxococcaceae bacterium]
MPGNLPVTSLSSGYTLHGEEGLQLLLPERGEVLGRVTQLSPTAVWVRPGREAGRPRPERLEWLCLEAGGTRLGPLRGEPRWSEGWEAGVPLGLRLLDVPVEQGRQVLALLEEAVRRGVAEPEASPLPVQEELSHSERILERLTAVCALGRRGVLRRPGLTVHVVLEHVDAGRGLRHWRCTSPEAGWGAPPY